MRVDDATQAAGFIRTPEDAHCTRDVPVKPRKKGVTVADASVLAPSSATVPFPELMANLSAQSVIQNAQSSGAAREVQLGAAVDTNPLPTKLYIGGEWVRPVLGRTTRIVDPATEKVIHRAPAATRADVDLAVKAAKKASKIWSGLTGTQRAEYLDAFAQGVENRQEEFAKLEVLNNGKPLADARVDVSDFAYTFRYYARLARKLDEEQGTPIDLPTEDFTAKMRKEPAGVAGMIIPWNYPMLMAAWKLAPALAAGCTMVLKPSELTPLTALRLAQISEEIGLPPGVLNVVTGTGRGAGAPLAEHPGVNRLVFTGGTDTGKRVMGAAAKNLVTAKAELGGKSPALVFEDANLDRVVGWLLMGVFGNQGEVCSATSRIIVHEKVADELTRRLVEGAKRIKIGSGLEEGVNMGPLISKDHLENVKRFIASGIREGATLVTGGGRPEGFEKGYYLEPTIFTDVTEDMEIWNKEIFGPVLCIKTFNDEEEAIRLANASDFGLAAAVMSEDGDRLERVAQRLEAGTVWKNCSQPVFPETPWGGPKKSGIGRELGRYGLDNFLEVKVITDHVAKDTLNWP